MKKYVIIISGVVAPGGLLFGFDRAIIAGTLTSLKTYFDLNDSAIGLVAAASIGCVPGAFFADRLADY